MIVMKAKINSIKSFKFTVGEMTVGKMYCTVDEMNASRLLSFRVSHYI